MSKICTIYTLLGQSYAGFYYRGVPYKLPPNWTQADVNQWIQNMSQQYEPTLEDKYGATQTAQELFNSDDPTIAIAAQYLVATGRSEFKYVKTYQKGESSQIEANRTLWVLDNSTVTAPPPYQLLNPESWR